MSRHAARSGPHTHGSVIHWARAYDLLTRLLGAGPRSAARTKTIGRAELQPGEKVLDVGCGPGVLTLLAAARVGPSGEAHGIDPSPGMVKLAQEKASKARLNATFRNGVIENLPYLDGSFDVVLSSLMLHHLPEDLRRKGFVEVYRVLRPGGRLLAFDLSGTGSFTWRVLSLVGHRLPERYGQHLAEMMTEAGFAPQILETSEKQYVTIMGRKADG